MSPSSCYPEQAHEVNDLLRTLSDDIRREIIFYFEQAHEPDVAPVPMLVSHIDAETPGTDPEQIYISLTHTHLPKLENRDWVDYDRRTEKVQYFGHDRADTYLSEVTAVFQ